MKYDYWLYRPNGTIVGNISWEISEDHVEQFLEAGYTMIKVSHAPSD